MYTGCHSWRNGWMNMMSPIHINHGGTKRSVMIMYHGVTHILGYVLWGKKATESYWHKACTWKYFNVNKGILVLVERTKRGRSPKWSFWEKHIWNEFLRSADMVSIMSSWSQSWIMLSKKGGLELLTSQFW